MLVNCDECKQDFEVDAKVKKIKGDVEKTFFTCPYCKKQYVAFYTNAKIRKKQEEIRKVRSRLNLTKDIGERIKLETKFKKLNKKISEEMKKLKCMFGK